VEINYQTIDKNNFNEDHRKILANMLKKQGKVRGSFNQKIDKCKLVCIAWVNDDIAAIGAIKEKTQSVFSAKKAGLPELSNDFEWELGYFYTQEKYAGKGIASMIAKLLIEEYGEENLMASTEITANPAMVKILKKHGFRLFGKPWKSDIHENCLGLFLKFKVVPTKSSEGCFQETECL
jgi:GNAT superfamily N-acetyltransferase